jgi:hypothetical protein
MARSILFPAILVLILVNTCISVAQSKPVFAPDKMETVPYGVAYYTE